MENTRIAENACAVPVYPNASRFRKRVRLPLAWVG
jgi:hypothetical protein